MTRANLRLMVGVGLLMAACSSSVPRLTTNPAGNVTSGTLSIKWQGSSLITIGFGKNVIGTVQLLAGTQPVAGATITFAISGDAAGSYLQQNTSTTDGNGFATVNILAGSKATGFKVGATTQNMTTPSYVSVDINGKYLGNVAVETSGYTGPAKPQMYTVALYNANTEGAGCATFRPDQSPFPTLASHSVPNINVDTTFQNVQSGLSVYATVVGYDGTRPVVSGCGGPVTVPQQNTVTINVELTTAVSSILGDYTFGQQIQPLNFLDPSSLTFSILHDVTSLIIDPGHFLAGGIYTPTHYPGGPNPPLGLCDLVGSSGAISSLCTTFAGNILDDGFTLLLGLSPDAQQINADLQAGATWLTQLNVGGVLTITDYEVISGAVSGTLVYNEYSLKEPPSWSGCSSSTDPCCGHHLENGAALGIDPVQASFTGTALPKTNAPNATVAYSFATKPTNLGLAYGKMAVSILEDVLLPDIVPTSGKNNFDRWSAGGYASKVAFGTPPNVPDGHISIGELVAGLLDCRDETQVDPDLCYTSSSDLGALVDNMIGELQLNGTADWNVTTQVVNGTLADTNSDLQVDTLTGQLQLTAETAGTPHTESDVLNATYQGKVCTSDGSCGSSGPGFACHFGENPEDQCFAQNTCGAMVGQDAGGAVCKLNTDCKSGLCMEPLSVAGATQPYPYECFQACATDQDCLGNGHCATRGYIQVIDEVGTGVINAGDVETITGTCVH